MTKLNPYWWELTKRPAASEQQALPKEVDILIVGAGLTGLSAARTAAKAGQSVLVVDQHSPGFGASSRNGGMLGGGHKLSIAEMTARYGEHIALGLLREAHLDSADFVRKVMTEEAIDCDYDQVGRFRGFWHTHEYETTARELEQLQKLLPIEASLLSQAQQHQAVASDLYRGGVVYHQHAAINPAKWVFGLHRAAVDHGALIQGNTAVLGLQKSPHGYLVNTVRGMVKAGKVLLATNGYTPPQMAALHRRVFPVPSFIITTENLGRERIKQLFPSDMMVVESRARHCYYRPSPDKTRIVFGARAALFDAPEKFAMGQLRKLLGQVFPQLGQIDISHSWRGFTGFSFEFMPHVGQIDGVWHAAGYSGNGNTLAPWLGHKAALQMIGDPAGETAFSHSVLKTRWWYHNRAWFLPFADLAFRGRDFWSDWSRS
ncbi:MAG: FAD-dependent oxidoreductase [Paracoccaceae bacterium]|nr:FAD-dependent oxidoreductase [Paracoccaceae bacterium]